MGSLILPECGCKGNKLIQGILEPMDAPELSVYGEAKGEYTRQLCVFLVPSLESYFLTLLDTAKEEAPSPTKTLWQFQTLLQAIPDWNQDKVVRETDTLQNDTKCDYLEELLTAVFIAHTKVLSAIRLTTKQKKLQITIPKLDHFLHRVLSESARSLWTNAYLFADGNHIERQKNLRQVSFLLQDAVLQAIRGLLPVKSILREYLHEDEEEENEKQQPKQEVEAEEEVKQVAESVEEVVKEEKDDVEVQEVKQETEAVQDVKDEAVEEVKQEEVKEEEVKQEEVKEEEVKQEEVKEAVEEVKTELPATPTIIIDTKPSVSFSQQHVMFDSDSLEANEIHDLPFAEAENRPPEEDEEEEEDESIQITDEILPMDAEELPL